MCGVVEIPDDRRSEESTHLADRVDESERSSRSALRKERRGHRPEAGEGSGREEVVERQQQNSGYGCWSRGDRQIAQAAAGDGNYGMPLVLGKPV